MFYRPLFDTPDTFPSFCSSPPPTTPYSLLTGSRRTPYATPPAGMQFGHLAESSPHTGYVLTPINYTSRRNSFNIENDLTTTVAASESSDGLHKQAAASGIPQPVPASVVNPWLGADMWSSTSKLVRGNASNPRGEGTVSRGKGESIFGSVQIRF